MARRKFLSYAVFFIVLVTFVFGSTGQSVTAMPASPTDESAVPHYFGPYPNWANSPFTLSNVAVEILGDGTGATATASVGANGAVTGITILTPGRNYTAATVNITGAGTGANANAVVNLLGVVTAVNVNLGGSGYTTPIVTFSGGGAVGIPASVSPSAATDTYNVTVGSATGGSFTLSVDAVTTGAIAWNASVVDVQAALSFAGVSASVTGSGSIGDPWVIVFAVAPTSVTINGAGLTQAVADASAVLLVDTATVTVGSATGGSFVLFVDAATTGAIAWNASAADVQAALLAAGVSASVTGTGSIGDPWVIIFTPAPASVTINGAGLTKAVADASVVAAPTHTFNANVGSAIGGTFTLSVDAATTAPIAWNAVAADVQAALLAAGVSASVTGSGSIATPWVITFAVAPATVTINGAGLTGAPTTGATATAYGGVDAVAFVDAGSGYSFPTVDFDMPNDPNGVQASGHVVCAEANCIPVAPATTVTIVSVVVDQPGSGYSSVPNVVIRDGTLFDPINHDPGTFTPAIATATLTIQSVVLDTYGNGYTSAPSVAISDATGTGSGASAVAFTNFGAVIAINVTAPGSGYVTAGGIKKFTDPLPGLCNPSVLGNCPDWAINPTAKAIPLGVPEVKDYNGVVADEYVIGLVQYRTSFSSSLPPTLVRGYVQLETAANAGISQHFPLTNELLDGTKVPVMQSDGVTQWYGVTAPQYLGPTLIASRDKPVRIVFYNLLPTGSDGDLFLPTDSTLMGSGMGPMGMADPVDQGTVMDEVRNPLCSEYPKSDMCFKDNRATLHLHGGVSPWISDGTPHQWITPANETTPWPEGVSVENVPDMNVCAANNDGCQTFYYTNQQSARLMFYHDHAWGITRLNVYAGEAAGYVITDSTEQALFGPTGTFSDLGEGIPLVIQDRTFVPSPEQLAAQDPTWDTARWGGYGNFWYHHVYMPAQNPGDPSGMSAFGRWMYGPWFWPPAANTVHGPIANPYYNMDPATGFTTPLTPPCNLDDPATWQYQTDPFCEPQLIPGTPNISVGMEQFNDTPIVNGVAYPTLTLEPKTYRLRILSAANDRFFNFQWYVADPATASTSLNNLGEVIGGTEVALNPNELAAAQLDPNIFPTPDTSVSRPGPDWIQIGTEGGFLPAPVVVDGQQVTTWIIDPTRFDVGNVDKHSLLLAPAERADVIVDFSQFAGQTLILYNDAPAAFPARVSSYDYYTGAPDLSPVGAPTILPGYGPNTRTILQVKIAATAPAPAFNLAALKTAFKHHADGSGVFEKGQHPIIVGQAAYNSAYGTNFAASGNCNILPYGTRCDGFVRVNDTSTFGFNTLRAQTTRMEMPLQPKAIHDEMNATTFDEFGRMQANLGVEAQPPVPGAQNVVLYPFVNPSTELINATGLPVGDLNVTPISSATDGTQIWRITHNGVDTHPIHFHLYDVQVLNRVTWDNIIIPPDATELGWKDTVRISPLEDTIVALRPIIPSLPWELPNSVRPLSPMMPLGSDMGFNNVDPQGNPTNPILNDLVNFGWEYVYHCHILSHEEMDMMRPVSVALPPIMATNLAFDKNTQTLSWDDNSINETSFVVQRSTDSGATWLDIGTDPSPLDQLNTHGARSFFDTTYDAFTDYQYRVVAKNTVGYGLEFPSMTVQSISNKITVLNPPRAPSNLTATLSFGPTITLFWQDNSTNETGFIVERSTDGVNFSQIATVGVGVVTYVDTTGVAATTYTYRVAAVNAIGTSLYSNTVQVVVPAAPAAPTNLVATLQAGLQVSLAWRDNANNETGFIVERSTDGVNFTQIAQLGARAGQGNVTYVDTTVQPGFTYTYRVAARNTIVKSAYSNTAAVTVPSVPAAPSTVLATATRQGSNERVTVTWTDNANNETNFQIQRATDINFTVGLVTNSVGANVTTFTTGNIARLSYYFRVRAVNLSGSSGWVNATPFPIPPAP